MASRPGRPTYTPPGRPQLPREHPDSPVVGLAATWAPGQTEMELDLADALPGGYRGRCACTHTRRQHDDQGLCRKCLCWRHRRPRKDTP